VTYRDPKNEIIERLREKLAEHNAPPPVFSPFRPVTKFVHWAPRAIAWGLLSQSWEEGSLVAPFVIISIASVVGFFFVGFGSRSLWSLLCLIPLLFWPVRAWLRLSFHLDNSEVYTRFVAWTESKEWD